MWGSPPRAPGQTGMRSTRAIQNQTEIHGMCPPALDQTEREGEADLIPVPDLIEAPEPALPTQGRSARITMNQTADTIGVPHTGKGRDIPVRMQTAGHERVRTRRMSTGGHIPDRATRGVHHPTPPPPTGTRGLLTLSWTGIAK